MWGGGGGDRADHMSIICRVFCLRYILLRVPDSSSTRKKGSSQNFISVKPTRTEFQATSWCKAEWCDMVSRLTGTRFWYDWSGYPQLTWQN